MTFSATNITRESNQNILGLGPKSSSNECILEHLEQYLEYSCSWPQVFQPLLSGTVSGVSRFLAARLPANQYFLEQLLEYSGSWP